MNLNEKIAAYDHHGQLWPGYWVPEARAQDLERKLTERIQSDQEISQSYLRIRELVGAWNTNLGGANRFEVTEAAVSCVVKRADLLTAATRFIKLVSEQDPGDVGAYEAIVKDARETLALITPKP